MRNPKPTHRTPEKERMLETVERLQARARIWEIGVARYLENEFNGDMAKDECGRVLNDASGMRREASRIQEEISRQQREHEAKRKPKHEANKK